MISRECCLPGGRVQSHGSSDCSFSLSDCLVNSKWARMVKFKSGNCLRVGGIQAVCELEDFKNGD